jgi:hypothetical protein
MRDTNNLRNGGGKVAKSLAVARSINFGGGHEKKYDWLFNDEVSEANETPR